MVPRIDAPYIVRAFFLYIGGMNMSKLNITYLSDEMKEMNMSPFEKLLHRKQNNKNGSRVNKIKVHDGHNGKELKIKRKVEDQITIYEFLCNYANFDLIQSLIDQNVEEEQFKNAIDILRRMSHKDMNQLFSSLELVAVPFSYAEKERGTGKVILVTDCYGKSIPYLVPNRIHEQAFTYGVDNNHRTPIDYKNSVLNEEDMNAFETGLYEMIDEQERGKENEKYKRR